MSDPTTECCVKFRPEKWDGKTFNWDKKQFIKESIPTLFHMPLPPMIGKKITKMWNAAKEVGADDPDWEECLVLFYDPHPFKSEMYMSVTKPVEGSDNQEISGTFEAKVFDGPYKAVPKFMKEMDVYLATKDKKAIRYYIHYAYCPKCAEKFGNNYMVFFAKV